ncbi:MAG TPA: ABC transporter substrate-binding protein, partial [Lachnospiraceae bacterium]|nr:ABC transporter substrate-binding protein [Lachnospiraceae bacterium]
VAKAMYFLASGEIAATTCSELMIAPVAETARAAAANIPVPENKIVENSEAQAILMGKIAEA